MFTVGGEPAGASAKNGKDVSQDKNRAKPSPSKSSPAINLPAGEINDPFAELENGPSAPAARKAKKGPVEENPFATLDAPANAGSAESPRRERREKSAAGPILGLLAALLGMLGLAVTILGAVLNMPVLYKTVGLPMSGFGLFLGFLGFLAALFLRGGLILSSFGSLICGVALVIAGGITLEWLDVGKILEMAESSRDAKRDDANKDAELKDGLKDGEALKNAPPKDGDKDAAKDGTKPPPATPMTGGWVDATKDPAAAGAISVRVTEVTVDYVKGKELTDPIATQRLLQIKLVLENTDPSKKVEFRSWGIAGPMGAGMPQLTDNAGKALKCISSFGPKAEVEGQTAKATIFPTRYVPDLVVFEAPPVLDKIAYLRLELPGANVGASGSLKFQVPRSMVIVKNTPAPTTPTTPSPPVVDAKSITELRQKLKSPDKNVRAEAITQLGAIGAPAAVAVPDLVGTLKDKDDNIRVLSAEAIGKIGPAAKAAVPALIAALEDEFWKVRASAAKALGQIGPDAKDARPALIGRLTDEEKEVKINAEKALRQIEGKK